MLLLDAERQCYHVVELTVAIIALLQLCGAPIVITMV
jgi:hypothetical protein